MITSPLAERAHHTPQSLSVSLPFPRTLWFQMARTKVYVVHVILHGWNRRKNVTTRLRQQAAEGSGLAVIPRHSFNLAKPLDETFEAVPSGLE